MKKSLLTSAHEPLKILLVGNNPIEMGTVLEKLQQVRSRRIITEIAFDIQTLLQRLVNFNPNFILIDDNIGKEKLASTLDELTSLRKTKDVPITLLKNSNYRESLSSSRILDYILKQNLSADSLYNTIKNSIRLKRTQKLLYKAYQTRRSLLRNLQLMRVSNLIG
jgi:hypothetical protein